MEFCGVVNGSSWYCLNLLITSIFKQCTSKCHHGFEKSTLSLTFVDLSHHKVGADLLLFYYSEYLPSIEWYYIYIGLWISRKWQTLLGNLSALQLDKLVIFTIYFYNITRGFQQHNKKKDGCVWWCSVRHHLCYSYRQFPFTKLCIITH